MIVLLVIVQTVPCYVKVPFIDTFLPKVLAENLKGGKLETDVKGIE